MTVVSVRIDDEIEENLTYIMSKRKSVDKSSMIRQLLHKFLEIEKIELLCDDVKERRMSAWKAARVAKIPLRKMLDELAMRNIFTYDENAFEEDLRYLEKKYEGYS